MSDIPAATGACFKAAGRGSPSKAWFCVPCEIFLLNRVDTYGSTPRKRPLGLFIGILSLSAVRGVGGFGFLAPFPSASPLGNVGRIRELPPLDLDAPFGFFLLGPIRIPRRRFPPRTHGRLRVFLVLPMPHADLPLLQKAETPTRAERRRLWLNTFYSPGWNKSSAAYPM